MPIINCNNCKKLIKKKFSQIKNNHFLYCSKQCKYSSINYRKNISKILLNINENKKIYKNCLYCGIRFYKRKKSTFCSRSCLSKHTNSIYKNEHIIWGQKSAALQQKRSKNEAYFAMLCQEEFENIITNKPIFNGWDADIIIPDLKIAILWNGIWHYKQIIKKQNLKQTQNRDRIKLIEIEKYGYTYYIIKDMGKHNKEFVEKEFNRFIEYINLL
jgi:hypothetical protein